MASREKSLAKNTLILTIGKISTQAISFFLLPLYTAYLSREDYGIVDLLSTLITLLLPILSLQMEQAIFRYMAEFRKDKERLKGIVSTSFTFLVIQIAIYICLFCVIQLFINNPYKWFVLTNLIAAVINFSLMQVLRGLGDNVGYAIAAFIGSVINICANLILILGLHWGAASMLTAAFIGNIVSIAYILYRARFREYYELKLFNKKELKEFLAYSIPLVPNELSWWAIRASDRFIVTAVLGTAVNGIVAVANKFPSIFIMVYNIFGIAWNESIILHLKDEDGDVYFSNLLNKMIRLFSCAALLLIVAMPVAFGVLVNENFNGAYNLIPLYMVGAILNVVIGLVSAVYIVHKQTKVIAKTSFISAVICVVSNLMLVRFIGVYASPVSSIIGFGIMVLYRGRDISRLVKVNWDVKYILAYVAVLSLIFLFYYLPVSYLKYVAIAVAVIFSYIANRKDIGSICAFSFNKIKSIF